jgi:ornithine carbamoyltransferase
MRRQRRAKGKRMSLTVTETHATTDTTPRHFIDLHRIDREALRKIIDTAHAMKKAGRHRLPRGISQVKHTTTLAMIFEKPSTRTRLSFDVAMRQLGGSPIVLAKDDMQLGRGETIADTARILSRFVDAVMIRANDHTDVEELAVHASIPVINGLTNMSHPCQILADVQTFEEKLGPIEGATVAWIGDGNNVANSWIHAALQFNFKLRLACPADLSPDPALLDEVRGLGGEIELMEAPQAAVKGADCVVTDTWVSMGDRDAARKRQLLADYQVDGRLMKAAGKKAIFMHCLPAHRGEEVTAEVIDGPRSVVFDEAENRLHAQKAILAWSLGKI